MDERKSSSANVAEPLPSIVDALQGWSRSCGDKIAVIAERAGETSGTLTYAALDAGARSIAASLQRRGLQNRRVLLLADGLEFVLGLFGCFYAGAIAVPAHQPRLFAKHISRLTAMLRVADLGAILAGEEQLDALSTAAVAHPGIAALEHLAISSLRKSSPAEWNARPVAPDDVAFIQFTSGSTGDPRGVVVAHGNLAENQSLMHGLWGTTHEDVWVGWLPLFHDLGLIGGLLHPLYYGASTVLIDPMDFIRRPIRWLRAISTHGGTMSAGPDFGYSWALQRVRDEELQGVDLSRWRMALNGAEPIQAATLRDFAARFASVGFRPATFTSGYGMAEATLVVTGTQWRELPTLLNGSADALERGEFVPCDTGKVRELVSSGRIPEGEVLIVDPESFVPLADRRVGEIWIRNPSVCRGYFNAPEESARTFGAHVVDGRGPYLRSGDLGFRTDGELVVTGRCKDLIIIRGRNVYPHDVERAVANCHAAIVPRGVAAVPVQDPVSGAESMVVVVESRGASDELQREIREKINIVLSEEFEVVAQDVVLSPPGAVLRTSSGKIRRKEIARQYLEGVLRTARGGESVEPVVTAPIDAASLTEILAASLGITPDRIRGESNLRGLGLDSLRTADVCAAIEQRWQRQLGLAEVLSLATVDDLLAAVAAAAPTAPERESTRVEGASPSGEPFALTPIQQAYWVSRNGAVELGGYSLHCYFELHGDIDLGRFEEAWNTVIARHPMLRAVIDAEGRQVVLEKLPRYRIAVTDLRSASEQEAEQALEHVRERLSHQRQDLTRWPVFEVCASRLRDAVRVHVSTDGIFLDFRSFQLLCMQLSQAYADPRFDASPPAYSFQEYVRDVQALRKGPRYDRSLQYWRERVRTLPSPPQLPLHCDPSQIAAPRFARRAHHIEADVWSRIASAGASRGLTSAALLLTAYARVLARWSEQQQLTVNVPLFNRPALHPAINDVMGNFSSLTLVEADLRERGSFDDTARRVQRSLHEALDHSVVDGVQVLREINSAQGRISGRGFPVVFTHVPAGLNGWDKSLFDILRRDLGDPINFITQTPQVWLDCQVSYDRGGVSLNWDSVDALFPAGVLDEMFEAFIGSLRALREEAAWTDNGDVLMPASARRLIEANNTSVMPVSGRSVMELIEERAAEQPGSVAVVDSERSLTYADLMRESGSLAEKLRKHGVERGSRVAIVIRKGWRQIVAVLAAVRAGAAYVPIDPAVPAERLNLLLADADAKAVLAEKESGLPLPKGTAPILFVEEGQALDGVGYSSVAVRGDDPVYVIYTSGTTGKPKGVVVCHRALASVIESTNRAFSVTAQDCVFALTSLFHDMSVYDIFGVLAAGGRILMPKEDERRDPAAWLALLTREKVTLWNSVPALLGMLLDYMEGHSIHADLSLRLAWIGGDWVKTDLVAKGRKLIPRMELCSVGGPTETTLWNIWYPIPRVEHLACVPYGKPSPNNRYYVLNTALEQCPCWVTGELYCGGEGVAPGYLNDAEATARKFIWHPQLEERLYRTGDLGRLLPDGNIEFRGRADFQFKIQGVRIEAGEIESCILKHCAVQEAVAVPVSSGASTKLAAFVVPQDTQAALWAKMRPLTGEIVTERAQRVAFKLERRGIRRAVEGTVIGLEGRQDTATDTERFLQRQSVRNFAPGVVSGAQLGGWLSAVSSLDLPEKVIPKYRYPSPGGLYPMQVYAYVRQGRVEGLEEGYYYYQPETHSLCQLTPGAAAPDYIATARSMAAKSALTLYLVADLDAIEPLYGRLGRDYCLIEAGCMSQLLMEEAPRHSLGTCPIGFAESDALRTHLRLGARHSVLLSLICGPVAVGRLNDWSPEESAGGSAEELARDILTTLRQHLPPALVPQHVASLQRLPLTVNGKVDRRALSQQIEATRVPASPRNDVLTPTQSKLCEMWARLLDREHVSLDDNFFEMGGNSILLVRFHVQLSKELQQNLAIAELFKCSTIRHLAERLARDEPGGGPPKDGIDNRGERQREAMRRRSARLVNADG